MIRRFMFSMVLITFFLTISLSASSLLLDTSGAKPDWMKYEGKTHVKVAGSHLFFGFSEGRVEDDTRTASYKNAEQQVSFYLGTEVKAMHKDYYEKEGDYTINASIQTGTELFMHSYVIEYYREKWNVEGAVVYKIYSKLEIGDDQYKKLESLAMAKVKMVVEGSSRSLELEKLFKKIAQKNRWNYDPVIDLITGNAEKKSLLEKSETAYVALLSPNISKKEVVASGFVMEGDISLEFYNIIFAKQPEFWNTGFISVTASDIQKAERLFMAEAFTRLSQAVEYDASVSVNENEDSYSSLDIYDYKFEKFYEDAHKVDADALLFPEKAIDLWTAFVNYGVSRDDSRVTYGKERVAALKVYVARLSRLKVDFAVDSQKIRDFLKMDNENIKRNIVVARAFIKKYGFVYGASVFEKLVDESIADEKRKKEIIFFIYEDSWLNELKILCENRDSESCYFYAYGVERSGGSVDDYEKYYEMSCLGDNAFACYNLSLTLLKTCLKGFELPLAYARKACELGNSEGCFKVGSIYNSGKCSAERDYAKALKYFIKSCDAGYYGGCAYAGAVYENSKDRESALKYYKKACDMGYEKACKIFNSGGVLK